MLAANAFVFCDVLFLSSYSKQHNFRTWSNSSCLRSLSLIQQGTPFACISDHPALVCQDILHVMSRRVSTWTLQEYFLAMHHGKKCLKAISNNVSPSIIRIHFRVLFLPTWYLEDWEHNVANTRNICATCALETLICSAIEFSKHFEHKQLQFKKVSKNCLRCIFYLRCGQACPSHCCHTKCLKNCHGSSKIDGYLDILPISICQLPCYES